MTYRIKQLLETIVREHKKHGGDDLRKRQENYPERSGILSALADMAEQILKDEKDNV